MKATEEHKKKMREYRKNHKEKYNEYQKKYYQTHREYYINYSKNKYNSAKYRIEKAIAYIENNWIEYSDFQYVDNDDELNIDCESIKELLDILKGSDKE